MHSPWILTLSFNTDMHCQCAMEKLTDTCRCSAWGLYSFGPSQPSGEQDNVVFDTDVTARNCNFLLWQSLGLCTSFMRFQECSFLLSCSSQQYNSHLAALPFNVNIRTHLTRPFQIIAQSYLHGFLHYHDNSPLSLCVPLSIAVFSHVNTPCDKLAA